MKIQLSITFLLFTICLFQLFLKVDCQFSGSSNPSSNPDVTSAVAATTSEVSATSDPTTAAPTTTADPTTTSAPVASSDPTTTTSAPAVTSDLTSTTTTSTLQPSVPESSSVIATPTTTTTTTTTATTAATTTASTTASSSAQHSLSSTDSTTTQASTTSSTSSETTRSSTSAAPSSTSSNESTKTNTTPIIVGSVVGGVVGIGLIVGLLACISRRGGCTKREGRNKRSDFDDYGLGDFPTHNNPAPTATLNAANNPVAPTIPRLNEQGNYYTDNYNNYNYRQGDYAMQTPQHGGYYYPQGNQQQQGFYEDGGYYYDNSSGMAPATAYPTQPSMQQTYSPHEYTTNNSMGHSPVHQNVYKPDDTASPVLPTGAGQQK